MIQEPISDDDSARIERLSALEGLIERLEVVTEAYATSALNRTELARARIVIRKPRATRMRWLVGLVIAIAIALALVCLTAPR